METALFNKLIDILPKAELHLHIEGCLEADLLWELAEKHQIKLPYQNIQQIKQAYNFANLQAFLDLYYQGANVLRDKDDYFELMWRYLVKCKEQNIVHAEIMFDPQTHTHRGVSFDTFMQGYLEAIQKAKQELGISVLLIMCFLRDLSQEDALKTLAQAKHYYEHISAVGLDSAELDNPPVKFKNVFEKAKTLGFKRVAHAGEEGPANYVWEAIQHLDVERIDHGVRSLEDAKLVAYLRHHQLPLTVCPLSNLKLGVVKSMKDHNILSLLEEGLMVTVNADDPAYFAGYLKENFKALYEALSLNKHQLITLIKNSFEASFLADKEKAYWLAKIDQLTDQYANL